MYFANSAVRNVTILQNSKSQLEALSARVSDLESERLALEEEVSIEVAKTLGLGEVQTPVFLVRGERQISGEALSLNIR